MKWLPLMLLTLPAFAADSASHFAPFDGVKVHYESYGSGNEAVVFIHGWTCDLTFWRGQAPVYSNRRSLLIDLPGHGQSDKPKVAYPMEFFARGIEAVLRDAGVERAVLVGHSLGGPIAYSFIRLFPAQAKALVLVDATVSNAPDNPSDHINTAGGAAGAVATEGAEPEWRQRREEFPGSGEFDVLRQDSALLARPDPREDAGNAGIRAHASVTSASEIYPPGTGEKFDVPALAIQAAQQDTEERAAAMRTIFPKLRLEKWAGSGHFLMMEDPARFNQSLERFLAGL